MTAMELREELRKAEEKEEIQRTVDEYKQIKNIIREENDDMTYNESCRLAMVIAEHKGIFDCRIKY